MKLICELTEDVQYDIVESKSTGKKDYFIEGIFMQGDMKNRNGRIYPNKMLRSEIKRYVNETIKKGRALGELGHPIGPSINLDRASHIITELKQNGKNFIGRAKIMDTPYGKIVKSFIDEGVNLGVSSRGMGSLKEKKNGINEVQNDFRLSTVDIVADPSAPDAFVRGIMERASWIMDDHGVWIQEFAENTKKTIRKYTTKQLNENKIRLFNEFLNGLVAKK